MNDPNKAINVNLSSLLSLKAELLRKQAEVNKAKVTRTINDDTTTAKSNNKSSRNFSNQGTSKPVPVSKKKDQTLVYETEDSALLEKSKRVLEAKSKYYERMMAGGKADENCLVLFKEKAMRRDTDSSKNDSNNLDHLSFSDSDSDSECGTFSKDEELADWVEYTDCLGRTRKCLKADLENVKQHDAELAASMPERLDQSKPFWLIDTKGKKKKDHQDEDDDDNERLIGSVAPTESIFSDGCSLISKQDEQRINWEKKRQENLEKSEVHYQDVFFDEARQHGVGYYAFSTDEAERSRQQQELENARLKTIKEQKRRDELRAQRENIIAERVRAAKNRQRARLGLPPLAAEEFEKEQQKSKGIELKETKEERKARKRAEKLSRRQEAEEAANELERQAHIRPWDKDKDSLQEKLKDKPKIYTDNFVAGVAEWKYKPERLPMSQEEWNERKRAERKKEFAPVAEPEPKLKRTNFSNEMAEDGNHLLPPSLPSSSTSVSYNGTAFVNYQTTRKMKSYQRRNYEPSEEKDEDSKIRHVIAIPPPENLDSNYDLPSHATRSKTSNELERSIEAGLRFLRNNSDKGTMSTKSSWTAKADY